MGLLLGGAAAGLACSSSPAATKGGGSDGAAGANGLADAGHELGATDASSKDAALGPASCPVGTVVDPSPLCEGKTPCPVVLHVDLQCQAGVSTIDEPSVAAGAANGGYVMFRALGSADFRPYLYTLDSTGRGKVESPALPCSRAGTRSVTGLVRSAPSGEARIFETCASSVPLYATEALTPVQGAWQSEWNASGRLLEAGLAPDGRAYALLAAETDNPMPMTAALATRSAQGAWTVGPAVAASASSLSIDADGDAHVVLAEATATAGRVALHELTGGTDHPILEVASASLLRATTLGKAGEPHDAVVAMTLAPSSTNLQVLVPSSMAAGYHSVALPELTPDAKAACPDGYWARTLSTTGPGCGANAACTLTGDLNGAFALVTTADGTAWLAVIVRHIDEDVSYAANGPVCTPHVDHDRSTQDLVLERVVPGATPALAVAARLPLGTVSLLEMAVAASGSRLSFAVLDIVAEPSVAKYIVVDTSALP
jgi:hypothetical protein